MDDITLLLAENFELECKKTLNKLCHFKQIDNYGLEEHIIPERVYFNELATNVLSKKKKKNNKTPLPKEIRCIGRKIDFSQCSRRKKGSSDFCGSHIKNLPNGKIGDDGACFRRTKQRRGRKRKDITLNVSNDSLMTTKKYINGDIYLMDEQNIVYTFKEDLPVILGILENGSIIPIP
jgi:hypothetical protein